MNPGHCYMVCSLPRSGSSLLCELLAGSGVAGNPAEFFDRARMAALRAEWGAASFEDYLNELRARMSGSNAVFGFKAHFPQLREAFRARDVTRVFPDLRCVHVSRRGVLRQAVSFARAEQTRQWTSRGPLRGEPPRFDAAHIRGLLERIQREEQLWESFFERHGSTPHRVVYEDLAEAPAATVLEVLAYLEIDVPDGLRIGPPRLQRQADLVSEEWVRRYQELDRPPPLA